MRLKIGQLVLLLFLPAVLTAQEINLSGYVRQYTGILLNSGGEYAIVQNTFDLNIEQSRDKVAFKANPYIYQYPGSEMEFAVREAYMDIFFESVDVRIGKQQIIWGKADGVFITDIVSPKDLSEFLLRDFDEIRMGVTGMKFNYYKNDNTFELVWLPVFTPTILPARDGIWFPRMNLAVPATFNAPQEVTASLENSEVFAKLSGMSSLVDFELMAGFAWDDDPVKHITKQVEPQSMQLTGLTVNPKYHRLALGGGSFSATVGPLVLRAEGAYYSGKYFASTDPGLVDAVVEKNYLHYLLGLDHALWGWRVSGQFIQQAILDYEETIDQNAYENMLTFLARRDFLRDTLTLEFFTYVGLNDRDAFVRPRLYYDLADGFELLLGANIFTGNSGPFGQYTENDMLYAKVKYSF